MILGGMGYLLLRALRNRRPPALEVTVHLDGKLMHRVVRHG